MPRIALARLVIENNTIVAISDATTIEGLSGRATAKIKLSDAQYIVEEPTIAKRY